MRRKSFYLVQMKELVALTFLFIISSCVQEEIDKASVTDFRISQNQNELLYNIPYADSIELTAFKESDEIIDYQLARKLALLESRGSGMESSMNWQGHNISQRPVLIYGQDSKPKYYEYIRI